MEIKGGDKVSPELKELILPEIEVLRQEVQDVRTELRLTNQRLDNVNKRLDDINLHLADQSRRIDKTNKRIDMVREELTGRIDSVFCTSDVQVFYTYYQLQEVFCCLPENLSPE